MTNLDFILVDDIYEYQGDCTIFTEPRILFSENEEIEVRFNLYNPYDEDIVDEEERESKYWEMVSDAKKKLTDILGDEPFVRTSDEWGCCEDIHAEFSYCECYDDEFLIRFLSGLKEVEKYLQSRYFCELEKDSE